MNLHKPAALLCVCVCLFFLQEGSMDMCSLSVMRMPPSRPSVIAAASVTPPVWRMKVGLRTRLCVFLHLRLAGLKFVQTRTQSATPALLCPVTRISAVRRIRQVSVYYISLFCQVEKPLRTQPRRISSTSWRGSLTALWIRGDYFKRLHTHVI